jgi:hypothetical protein
MRLDHGWRGWLAVRSVPLVAALGCGGGARDEAFDKGTERKPPPASAAPAAPKVEPTPELDGLLRDEPVELRPSERDFPARRKALDEQLRTGFTALPRTVWPAHGREVELSGGKTVRWTDDGALALLERGKSTYTQPLPRKDLIPVAVHPGPTFVAVQVSFDPKDASTADASYSECVVLPLGAS